MKSISNPFRNSVAWCRSIHREAALDSLRNVLAIVGGATILADFTTIKLWLVAPMLFLAFLIWFLDYERHFRGKTIEDQTVEERSAERIPPSAEGLISPEVRTRAV